MKSGEDCYALITGASAGIGKAIAEEFAWRGHNLVLAALPGTGLQELCGSLSVRHNISVLCYETDLCKPDSAAGLKRFTVSSKAKVGILVNNVGIGTGGEMGSYSGFAIEETVFLNMRCATMLINMYLDELKSRQSAFILNIGSFSGFTAMPFKSIYAASKSYIYNLSLSLREELRGTNVSVSVAMPGPVITNEYVRKRMIEMGAKSRLTAIEPGVAAKEITAKMFRRRAAIIPGSSYKFIYAIAAIMPFGLLLPILRNIFRGVN